MKRMIALLLAGVFSLAVTVAPRMNESSAQVPEQHLEKVLRAWSQRHRFKNVQYTLTGVRVYPKGSLSDESLPPTSSTLMPREDVRTPLRRLFILDLEANRFRLEVDEQALNSDGPFPVRRTDVFDGKEYKILSPGDPNPQAKYDGVIPDMAIVTGDAARRDFEFKHWPMFDALGIIQNLRFRSTAKTLTPKPDIDLMLVHGNGVHQGRPCLILRTYASGAGKGPYEEYWVDQSRDCAVVKHILMTGKAPAFELLVNYEKKMAGRYPSGWTYIRRYGSGKVAEFEEVRVSEFAIDQTLSDEDFTLKPRPGMVVAKTNLGTPTNTGGEPSYPNKQRHFYQLDDTGNPHEIDALTGKAIFRWHYWLWGSLSVLIFVGIFSWLLVRRLRGRHLTGE
jgi:hypothetical protein